MTSPNPRTLPRPRRRSASRTRAHSVTTWRALRRRTGSLSALEIAQVAGPERPADSRGGTLALGPPRGVGGSGERAGHLAVHDDEGGLFGYGDRTRHEIGEVDEEGMVRHGGGDGQRVEQAHRSPGTALGLLAVLRQRDRVRVVAERQQQRHREGGTRRQTCPHGQGAAHGDGAPRRRRCHAEEAGRQGRFGRDPGGVAQGDLEWVVRELVRSDPHEEASVPGREGDLGGELDRHRERQAAVVVGVITDDDDASGGSGSGHTPSLARRQSA